MGFEPFQDALQKAARNYGIAREFRAIRVCKTFQSIVPLVFENNEEAPKTLTQNTFRDGILTIKVPNSTWANEVMIKREILLEALESSLKSQSLNIKIKELKTRIY